MKFLLILLLTFFITACGGGSSNGPSANLDESENAINDLSTPDQPVVEPEQPVVEPEQPVVEPEQPVVEPEQPVVEPEQPVVEPEQPVVEPEQPVVEPVQPVVEPVQPVVEPVQPVVEPVQPVQPVVEPEQPVQPVVEPEQPVIAPEPSTSLSFTKDELVNTVLISKSVTGFEGVTVDNSASILLFENNSMREITLEMVDFGLYRDGESTHSVNTWSVLTEGVLEVQNDDGIVCKTEKVSVENDQLEVKAECTNSIESVDEKLITPISLNVSDFSNLNVENLYEGVIDHYDFGPNSDFDYSISYYTDEPNIALGSGKISQSKFKNAVRIDYPIVNREIGYGDFGYGLLFLLQGNLNAGLLMEVRYLKNGILEDVRFMRTSGERWLGDQYFINWNSRM